MASYVSKTLVNGETVEYQARVHWWVFLRPFFYACVLVGIVIFFAHLSVASAFAGKPYPTDLLITIAVMIGVLYLPAGLIGAWIHWKTTELVITNKRVIAKFGLVRRHASEIQLQKVEGAELKQGIIGRLLGFASIQVRGTGGDKAPVPFISRPLQFKQMLAERL